METKRGYHVELEIENNWGGNTHRLGGTNGVEAAWLYLTREKAVAAAVWHVQNPDAGAEYGRTCRTLRARVIPVDYCVQDATDESIEAFYSAATNNPYPEIEPAIHAIADAGDTR